MHSKCVGSIKSAERNTSYFLATNKALYSLC